MPQNPPLDPDLVARARALWEEGKTSTTIGKMLGKSKNSIVSMARRRNWPSRDSPIIHLSDAASDRIVAIATADPTMAARVIAAEVKVSPTTVLRVLADRLPCWASALRDRVAAQQSRADRARAERASVPSRRGAAAGPADRVERSGTIGSPWAPRAPATAPTDPPAGSLDDAGVLGTQADGDAVAGEGPADDEAPVVRRLSLADMVRGCQWPLGHVGDPGFRFCGDPRDGGLMPYCHAHHRLAVRPKDDDREARAA